MKEKEARHLLNRYRIADGIHFKLADHNPADAGEDFIKSKHVPAALVKSSARISDLQMRLYASESWSLLLVLQAMDAGGKDGTIRHVMSGVNPQGVTVTSFKQPGPEDLRHGFLWRVHAHAPAHGQIAIFNRSHYEDVLITRVHPALLDQLHLPEAVRGEKFWQHRIDDIVAFERYLAHQGTLTVKVFLHLSKAEQKQRFLKRLDEPGKNWKFSAADLKERDYWDDYQVAYQEAITATATPHAPWFIVPADNKDFAHLVVALAIIEALESMQLREPRPPEAEQKLLKKARKALEDS